MPQADPLDRTVQSCMTRVLSALSPDTSIAAAARLLHDQHLSGAPVVDEAGRLHGVVSQTDLAGPPRGGAAGVARYFVVHEGKTLASTAIPGVLPSEGVVSDVMQRNVQTVSAGSSLRDAVRLMVTREIHRVLVVEEGRLVGLVSTMDVLRALVPDRPPQDDQGFLKSARRSPGPRGRRGPRRRRRPRCCPAWSRRPARRGRPWGSSRRGRRRGPPCRWRRRPRRGRPPAPMPGRPGLPGRGWPRRRRRRRRAGPRRPRREMRPPRGQGARASWRRC